MIYLAFSLQPPYYLYLLEMNTAATMLRSVSLSSRSRVGESEGRQGDGTWSGVEWSLSR